MLLDFNRVWAPYIYLYTVGGIAFLIGMYLIIKTRSLNLKKVHHKKWLVVLIVGFIYYASIHGLLILVAQK
jgi:hypothetical protein